MRNLISVSAIMAVLSLPGYATIQSGSTCDTTNLGQSENNSTANVEADWTANTININWYIDDEAQTTMATNTCTYDGTITLPTQPTKTGYTFAGWQLRASAAGPNNAPADPNCAANLTQESCHNADLTCSWSTTSGTCVYMVPVCAQAADNIECTQISAQYPEGRGCTYTMVETCAPIAPVLSLLS